MLRWYQEGHRLGAAADVDALQLGEGPGDGREAGVGQGGVWSDAQLHQVGKGHSQPGEKVGGRAADLLAHVVVSDEDAVTKV